MLSMRKLVPLLVLMSVAFAPPLLAEEAGKQVEVMATTDVAGLKTLIRAEILGGSWTLMNEGEMLLLFSNPDVSRKDKLMLGMNPFGDSGGARYRFRATLMKNPESITVTLNKELAYTDDKEIGRASCRERV